MRNGKRQTTSIASDGITRRDFVGTSLIGAGAGLLTMMAPGCSSPKLAKPKRQNVWAPQGMGKEWTGPGGLGDYAVSNGNTHGVVNSAHAIAHGEYVDLPNGAIDTGEIYDVVAIGGGFAGLSAGYTAMKQGSNKCLILDNHPIFGGEGKMNIFEVEGQQLYAPQGSNDFCLPTDAARRIDFVHPYWDEIGLPSTFGFASGENLNGIKVARDNFGPQIHQTAEASVAHFYFNEQGTAGRWASKPWLTGFRDAPISEAEKHEIMKFAFDANIPKAAPKDFGPWLDSMSYKDYIEKVLGYSPRMTAYIDMVGAAGAFGCSASAYSAYGAYHFAYPGTGGFYGGDGMELLSQLEFATFPGGNAGIARYFVKAMIPDAIVGARNVEDVHNNAINFDALDRADNPVRIRLGATGVYVKHDGDPETAETVTIAYEKGGRTYLVKARGVVMAGGGWMNKHVCRDLPPEIVGAYDAFHHGPMLTVNVALRNWKFLAKLGVSAVRWFGGEMGFWVNVRQPMQMDGSTMPLDPDKPVVLSNYIAFPTPGQDARTQGLLGRQTLFSYSFADLERWVREHYTILFGDHGFDADRDIAGIVTNRWGHAYVCPGPGFFFDKPGRTSPMNIVRKGYGRVFFGHSETAGRQLWSVGVEEGRRATMQVLDKI